MNTYRGVIFDLDGTLLDTIADIGYSANQVLTENGQPTYDLPTYKKFVGRGFMNLLHRAFPADTPEEQFPALLERLLQVYDEHFMDQTVPYPGMVDLVNELHAAGIPVAVNSNKRDQYTKALIAKNFPGIPFVDVVGEGAAFPRKPKPDGALHIAAKMGLVPEQILYVGDSDTDMQTGHNAGMDTVGCAWGFRGEQELRENGATYIAYTAEDIRKLFWSPARKKIIMPKKHHIKINKTMIITIMALAWPTMLEQLMQTAVQYIDTAMVGSLGTQATAAVGATTTVNWLIGSSISALSIGFLAFIAKAHGASDEEGARRAVGQAVLAVLVTGTIFTILTLGLSSRIPVWMQVDPHIQDLAARYFFILYLPMLPRAASIIFGTVLRASGDTKTPMKIGVLVNLINVVGNFLLIYPSRTITVFSVSLPMWGAGLGVVGAAAASALAFAVGGIAITIILWRHPRVSFRGQSIRPDKAILGPCLKVALPNFLQRFGTSLGYVAFASMINSIGEVATAAHTIANTVESAFYIPGYGMQTAAATLAGNAYGAGDEKRMKELSSMFIPLEILLMIFSGACLFFTAPMLVDIFSDSSEVITLGTTVLRMVAVSEPFYGFSIIVEGMMQGVGKTKSPFIYNIIGMWGIRIVGTFICTQLLSMGLVSAWACMIAHNLLLFVLFLIAYVRGTWNPLHIKAT